ncbi:MAG: VOC family protein [Niallia sp.]
MGGGIEKMTIIGVHHVQITIPKGLEQQAKDFYCGVLGLGEIKKPSSLQGRGGFWLSLGNIDVHVGTEEGFDRYTTKSHLAYQVDNMSDWKNKLSKLGVEIAASIPIEGFERFEFRDPFGNRVEIIEKKLLE